MSKLTKDQKRKKKVQEKAKAKQAPTGFSPYFGEKYKSKDLIPVLFAVEGTIHDYSHECKDLSNNDVSVAIKRQIQKLNKVDRKPIESPVLAGLVAGLDSTLESFAAKFPTLSKTNLIGVLRTILGSIETHETSTHSEGYLAFIERFFHQMDHHVHTEDCNH